MSDIRLHGRRFLTHPTNVWMCVPRVALLHDIQKHLLVLHYIWKKGQFSCINQHNATQTAPQKYAKTIHKSNTRGVKTAGKAVTYNTWQKNKEGTIVHITFHYIHKCIMDYHCCKIILFFSFIPSSKVTSWTCTQAQTTKIILVYTIVKGNNNNNNIHEQNMYTEYINVFGFHVRALVRVLVCVPCNMACKVSPITCLWIRIFLRLDAPSPLPPCPVHLEGVEGGRRWGWGDLRGERCMLPYWECRP